MLPKNARYFLSVLLVCLLIATMPVTAFAATRYVYYQGSFSDQVLNQILKWVSPGDDFKILRSEPKPQPSPDPQPDSQLDPQLKPDQQQDQQLNPDPQPDQQPKPDPQPRPQPAPGTDSITLTTDEQQMVNLVNLERQRAGLKPLTVDKRLVRLARLKSQDMVDKNYFSHQSPTYGSPFDMMKNAGVTYRWAGENIAGAGTVDSAHNALMNSAGHRANILKPEFTHIGIGIVPGGPYGMMFTQMFIGI